MKSFLTSIKPDKINYNYNKTSNDGLMWLCREQNLKNEIMWLRSRYIVAFIVFFATADSFK